MIRIKNVNKLYSKRPVLQDINIDLPKGKVISFIGSNGAGKSTLLSIISRVLNKDSGQVFIEGKELSNWKNEDLAKVISILRQSNDLNIKITVRDLISFGRFPHSKGKLTKEDIKKVDEAIKYMEIDHLQDRYLDELSGGQRQIAFIAMVIAQDTEYILLDEPLNNLDMRHSVKIMKNIKRLVEESGKTVIVVIHDINFVSCYSDYIIAMKDGKIIKHDTTEKIISEDVLKQIYSMDISVKNIDDKNICLYYM